MGRQRTRRNIYANVKFSQPTLRVLMAVSTRWFWRQIRPPYFGLPRQRSPKAA
jgi:hypothetical protein